MQKQQKFLDKEISRQIVPEFFPSRSISRFVIIPSCIYTILPHHFDYGLFVVAEIDNHQSSANWSNLGQA